MPAIDDSCDDVRGESAQAKDDIQIVRCDVLLAGKFTHLECWIVAKPLMNLIRTREDSEKSHVRLPIVVPIFDKQLHLLADASQLQAARRLPSLMSRE